MSQIQETLPDDVIRMPSPDIPPFDIGASLDWLLTIDREPNWAICGRAMEVFEAGFTNKPSGRPSPSGPAIRALCRFVNALPLSPAPEPTEEPTGA